MKLLKTRWFGRYARREKSGLDNIEADELETLREIGAAWLEANQDSLEHAIKEGILIEVLS